MDGAEVAVTGIGMVTPLGPTARESGEAWRRGASSPRRRLTELSGTALEDFGVAPAPDFDAAARLGSGRMLKYMSDAAVLGAVAAHEAMEDADARARFKPERTGLFAATGLTAANPAEVGGMIEKSIDGNGDFCCRLFGEKGLAETNPLISFKILANIPPCLVSIIENVRGPNYVFNPWEGQGAAALLEAWKAVRNGEVDCALAGAADSPANPATLVYLRQADVLKGNEFPASAAAYLVFERLAAALSRGRRIYAAIADMSLIAFDGEISDPLAPRLGRCFAAAPAVLLALACMGGASKVSIKGTDGLAFEAALGR